MKNINFCRNYVSLIKINFLKKGKFSKKKFLEKPYQGKTANNKNL